VDLALRTLADAGLALDAAEEALAAGEAGVAEERLAEVDEHLGAVRAHWPELSAAARAVAGPAGRAVRERHDALVRRLPKRRALSEAAPTAPDPDEEREPDDG
jgi:phage shock protein A